MEAGNTRYRTRETVQGGNDRERTSGEWARMNGGKHVECYHAGDYNRSDIQGMVELPCRMVILGAGAG